MTRWLVVVALLAGCTSENAAWIPDAATDRKGGEALPPSELGASGEVGPGRELGAPDLAGKDLAGKDLAGKDLASKDHAVKPDAFTCTAGAFLSCKTTAWLQQCNATGDGTVIVDCSPYLCDPANKRCAQCDPKALPFCQGSDLVSCTVDGLLVKTTCPGGCSNGACASCTLKPYYKDGDGDGYGNPAVKVEACAQPWGFVANGLDCDDLDAAAHPGQTAFFNLPTKGTGTYDYSCDKLEEREYPSAVACVISGMTCVGDGWAGAVPACGTVGVWSKCNKQGGMSSCGTTTSNKIQSCR